MAKNGKKPKPARRRKPTAGSAKREPVGKPGAKVHNLKPHEWIDVCGSVTRMGAQLVEIPASE